MKALTTSEATKYLIDNGFKNNSSIKIDSDIFGGDIIYLNEYPNGESSIRIGKQYCQYSSYIVNSYYKIKSKDKKELIQMILNKL